MTSGVAGLSSLIRCEVNNIMITMITMKPDAGAIKSILWNTVIIIYATHITMMTHHL